MLLTWSLLVCYNCKQKGHVCLNKGDSKRDVLTVESRSVRGGTCWKGRVEGREILDKLLDTGCSRTMVHRRVVPGEKISEGDTVTIWCAHGNTVLYPLADLEIEVDGFNFTVEAAVSETLPVTVLLGRCCQGFSADRGRTLPSKTTRKPSW